MTNTNHPAPNHEEARILKVRFRHLHQKNTNALGGTLVSQQDPDDASKVRVSMVVLNPKDIAPRETDLDRLCTVLRRVLSDKGNLKLSETPTSVLQLLLAESAAARLRMIERNERIPCVASRADGRRRAWARLQEGQYITMDLKEFIELISAASLAAFVAYQMRLPESACRAAMDLR